MRVYCRWKPFDLYLVNGRVSYISSTTDLKDLGFVCFPDVAQMPGIVGVSVVDFDSAICRAASKSVSLGIVCSRSNYILVTMLKKLIASLLRLRSVKYKRHF